MTAELSSINPNTSLRGVVVSQDVRCSDCGSMESDGQRCSDCPERVPRWYADSTPSAKPAKPRPDVEAMALKYGQDRFNEGFQRAVDQRSRHPAYDSLGFDEPDFEPLSDELERLDVAAYSLEEILKTTTALLLVLSQPKVKAAIASLGTHGPEAVERFCNAEKEARNG